MERALVAQQVANKLFATEDAIDQAIANASLLVAEMIKARQEIGVSAVFGDECLTKATAAISALSQARTAMVACHHELNDAKLRVGIRTQMAGASPKPPANARLTSADLRQVG